jgi:hypothetical protein
MGRKFWSLLLPAIKPKQNRHQRAFWQDHSSPHCQLPDQHRELESKNRSRCYTYRKNRLRDPDGEHIVVHVRTPLIELPERCSDCAARQRATNGIPNYLLSKT